MTHVIYIYICICNNGLKFHGMQTNDHVFNTKKMQYLLSNDNLQKFNEPLPYCNRLLLLYKQRILCRVDPNTYTPTYTLAGSVARASTLKKCWSILPDQERRLEQSCWRLVVLSFHAHKILGMEGFLQAKCTKQRADSEPGGRFPQMWA